MLDLNEKKGMISEDDEDGYGENVIPKLDPEDGEEGGISASTSNGGED